MSIMGTETLCCDCACRGCELFHESAGQLDDRDTQRKRILRALELAIDDACRSRGIEPWDRKRDDQLRALHSRASALAGALATMIDNGGPRPASPSSQSLLETTDYEYSSFACELIAALRDKQRLS